jgi:hypothetical protein
VVGRAQAQRVASGARLELGQEFGDVAALRRKRLRAPGVLRIVAQQVVTFEPQTAALTITASAWAFSNASIVWRAELHGLLLFSRVH